MSSTIQFLVVLLLLTGAFGPHRARAEDTYTNPVIDEIGPADPCVVFFEGKYYLYPTGDNRSYRVNPTVKRGNGALGPGHCCVTKDRAGKLWMVYHQQKDDSRPWNRFICIDPLWFDERGSTRKSHEGYAATRPGSR